MNDAVDVVGHSPGSEDESDRSAGALWQAVDTVEYDPRMSINVTLWKCINVTLWKCLVYVFPYQSQQPCLIRILDNIS